MWRGTTIRRENGGCLGVRARRGRCFLLPLCSALLFVLPKHALVDGVPLAAKAITPSAPTGVGAQWDTTRPQGDEEHHTSIDFGQDDFGGDLLEDAAGDGGYAAQGYGYGHADDEEYGYGPDEEDMGKDIRGDFAHQDLNDPDKGLAEEWENFMLFDKNSDAGVDLQEWLYRLLPPSDRELSEGEMRRWKREFQDADLGKDGQLGWDDWKAMLFHDEPQEAGWVDGHAPDALPPLTEDILLGAFEAEDKDNDGELTMDELAAVIRHAHHRQGVKQKETTHNNPERDTRGDFLIHNPDEVSDNEFQEISRDVLQELDLDKSGTISSTEFLAYGKPFEHVFSDSEDNGGHDLMYGQEVDIPEP